MMNGVYFRVVAASVLPRRTWWKLLLLVLVSPLVAGCGPSAVEGEEEAHHEFPPHRPSSYEQLVSDLEQRVTGHQAAGSDPGDDTELRDLAGWIPEFAADSELKRQDFGEAVRLARRLQPELGPLLPPLPQPLGCPAKMQSRQQLWVLAPRVVCCAHCHCHWWRQSGGS